jgi:hypothetical protein
VPSIDGHASISRDPTTQDIYITHTNVPFIPKRVMIQAAGNVDQLGNPTIANATANPKGAVLISGTSGYHDHDMWLNPRTSYAVDANTFVLSMQYNYWTFAYLQGGVAHCEYVPYYNNGCWSGYYRVFLWR